LHEPFYVDFPNEIPDEDYGYSDGVEYRRIPGCRWHFISSDGYVISFIRETPSIISPSINKNGYYYVKIHGRHYYIHRLIAEAFIPNPNNYPVVRHLNDDASDNSIENLAWGTQSDNRLDCIRNGHDFKRPVYCFEIDKEFSSCIDTAKYFKVSPGYITVCCKNASSNIRGHHLCYLSDRDSRFYDKSRFKQRGYKPVIAISPSGEKLYFKSRNEASKELGIPACGISSVINGHILKTHNWTFKEGDYI
jgi:hypothetical protein